MNDSQTHVVEVLHTNEPGTVIQCSSEEEAQRTLEAIVEEWRVLHPTGIVTRDGSTAVLVFGTTIDTVAHVLCQSQRTHAA